MRAKLPSVLCGECEKVMNVVLVDTEQKYGKLGWLECLTPGCSHFAERYEVPEFILHPYRKGV